MLALLLVVKGVHYPLFTPFKLAATFAEPDFLLQSSCVFQETSDIMNVK